MRSKLTQPLIKGTRCHQSQHQHAFRISRPRWEVMKGAFWQWVCRGFTLYQRVSKCHSHILPALSQPSAIPPSPLAAVCVCPDIYEIGLREVKLLQQKFQKWNAPWHFALMYLDMRRGSERAWNGSGFAHQSSADLFVFSLPLWAPDDRKGRFCFCVVASARL